MQPGQKATVLCGRTLARQLEEGWRERALRLKERRARAVGLGVILVGDDAASALYVRNKEKAAARAGFVSHVVRVAGDASAQDIERAIETCNRDEEIDAFLLQLPLPGALQREAARLVSLIHPDKDADGLHPYNVGQAALGAPGVRPCTPLGCMKLIEHAGIEPRGLRAVVLGRSPIVGQPMAMMLSQADATVTVCHAQSVRIAEEVRRADVVVSATGVRHLVPGHWLKPGACVIDVGISRYVDANGQSRVTGDVDFASAQLIAGFLTPVPGGVGPMTISMLLYNALVLAERRA